MSFRTERENAGITAKSLYTLANIGRNTLTRIEDGSPIERVYAARAVNALARLSGKPYTIESFPDISLSTSRRGRKPNKKEVEK